METCKQHDWNCVRCCKCYDRPLANLATWEGDNVHEAALMG